jgi:hypothetical protein
MRRAGKEQRREVRVRVSQRLWIRVADSDHPAETCTAGNVSRSGLYFITSSTHYFPGTKVYVVRNFDPDDRMSAEEIGKIVRVDSLSGDRMGVAIQILVGR